MATRPDLEIRIGAELTEIRAALAALKKDLQGIAQVANAGRPFIDAERAAKGASKAAVETAKAVRDATTLDRASRVNPFQNVVEGARQAQTAAQAVERSVGRARDARGRFVGGGGGGGGGGGEGGALGGFGRAGFAGLAAGATSALGPLSRLLGTLTSIATALALISAADEMVTLNARLKLSTSSVEDFTRAQKELFDIAQRTRSGLGETINLFSRISLATKDAKVGQDVLLDVVETINKAVQLSGASTQAAEAALVQLGQGLASGTLRGEELNSVLEQTPALADAIAKGMGITRGELRKFGQEGKIGAQQVIDALQKQRDEVNRQFAELPVTVGQAVTQVKNASLQLLATFNESSGATAGLAKNISELAEFLGSDEVLGAAVEFSAIWTSSFADLAEDVQEAVQIIEDATRDIMVALGLTGGGEGLISLLKRAFKELPVNLRTTVQIMTVSFAGMIDVFIAQARAFKEAVAALFTDDTIADVVRRREAEIARIGRAVREETDRILQERERLLKDAADVGRGAVAGRRAATDRDDSKRPGGRGSRGKFATAVSDEEKRAADALRKAEADRDEKLLKDSADRQLNILEQLNQDALISLQQYYDAKQSIELAAVQRTIEIKRRELSGTTNKAERTKILTEIELLERQKTDIEIRATRDRQKAVEQLDKELASARAQDLENQGKGGEAAKIRLEAEFKDLLQRLERAGNQAGVTLIRRLIDTGVAREQFAELESEFQRVMTRLQDRQASITDQLQSGAIAPATANQEQTEARQRAAAELEVLVTKMRELADATNDPRIQEGAQRAAEAVRGIARDSVTGINAALQELRATLAQLERDFARLAVGAGVDALSQLFLDLAEGSKEADDALKDFVRSFARSMAEIASRALATYAVLQLLDAIYPGLGQAVAAGASVGARVKHSGGDAGQGTTRRVNPLLFIGAPRFHSGTGDMGLKAGEIPAILQEGEKVQSRAEVALEEQQGGGGGGGGQAGTRIVNLWDPNDLVDAMASSAGERVILNVIERNKGAVRQKLR